ncbi:MAG: response regulator transcription factor [Giesbergeria sp.]|nr:response regulator transcription factor [Giesbergeria sp.]
MRIAALDDDLLQLEFIGQVLQAQGHSCQMFETGAALLAALNTPPLAFDLLIVDWELPDTSGPDIVQWVRQHLSGALPILFITHRQSESDIVRGLESGADDFMAKPIRRAELQARVASLLRRAYPHQGAGNVLEFGPYRFLPETRTIEMHGAPVELRNLEYELALYLFQHKGQLLTREHLRETIWGQVPEMNSRTLDTHLSRVRTQLDLRPANGYLITSVYGVGYRFESVDEE